ncbi:HlyD family efflux transporter periplasmic adaptor subunit [Chamaesiphon sp. VAR_69_metabat_338]|uniref:HlyD family efflux transporter periplasmic adaptor subunit n=1 Tax=Chamaesiphon sp. VAR_69_metabat_338 TaxID=2964704 RepID=UPI00286E9F16|nr:HlyD family efflux transporter periplasmic adaptor subunit [Chamaesiphon sp. VAR_69_metabat_338]
MDNSQLNRTSGAPEDTFTEHATKTTILTKIVREPESERSGSPIQFPKELDYQILHQTTPEEFLPTIGRWMVVGGMVMVGSFGGAIALSAVLKYKVTVQAPAAIRPMGEVRLVQSTIEGSVLSISVRENQTVRKGDPIATVKDLRLENKLKTKRSQLIGDIQKARHQLGTIDLQLIAFKQQGTAEIEQSNRTIAGSRAEFSRAERDYRDKQIATQADVAEAQANWKTAQKEQQAAEAELTVAEANLKSLQSGYQAATAKSQRYQSVATAGAISTNLLEEAQLSVAQQAQSIAAQQATIVKQQQLVARVAQTVAAAKAKFHRTQVALNPLRAESETIVQKIASERANSQAAIARRQQERQKLLQQRAETANQIASITQELHQIATELKPTPILAPISGTIQELNLRNSMQVVNPGDRLAKIIPTVTPLNIMATVASADIDNVKVGYPVQMRVSACPHTDYGVVSGKVREVSADAKSIDKNGGNNPDKQSQAPANGVYEATIVPDALTLSQGGKTCQIRSGMDGRADIIAKEETVLQFMLRKARLFT